MINSIATFTRERLPKSLELLEELVEIPTGVGNLEGIERCGTVLRREWQALGFEVQRREIAGGPVWIADRPGRREAPVVLMLAHIDTVFGGVDATFVRHDERATGPGVADMKGGVVVGLDVVRALDHVGLGDRFRLIALTNSDEESSSTNSRSVIEEVARSADLVLVFEPARPSGAIVSARRGLRRYRISVEGRAAHAGVEPELGASAIEALAHKIVALQALNQRRPDLNVNVGTIRGGSNPNVVPESATAEIDVRMSTMATLDWVHRAIVEIAERPEVAGTRGRADLYAERPPMVASLHVEHLLNRYRAIGASIGIPLDVVATGGGSDGNFTAAQGKLTLDGLGPVGGGYHSEREFVIIKSLGERAALTAAVLADLGVAPIPGWVRAMSGVDVS